MYHAEKNIVFPKEFLTVNNNPIFFIPKMKTGIC